MFAATISSSCLTYSAGPIFFEFTAELVYPVPEGIVGGFLTTFYNSVGMVFLFLVRHRHFVIFMQGFLNRYISRCFGWLD